MTLKPEIVHRLRRFLPARLVHRFVRDRDGATAVEFGIVLLPFILVLFITMETALVFFADQVLESAAADAARLLRTGQAAQLTNPAAFKAKACTSLVQVLFDCDKLQVDVKKLTSFVNPADISTCAAQNYDAIGAGDRARVHLIYPWPIVTGLVQPYLADTGSTTRCLVTTSVFVAEPF